MAIGAACGILEQPDGLLYSAVGFCDCRRHSVLKAPSDWLPAVRASMLAARAAPGQGGGLEIASGKCCNASSTVMEGISPHQMTVYSPSCVYACLHVHFDRWRSINRSCYS